VGAFIEKIQIFLSQFSKKAKQVASKGSIPLVYPDFHTSKKVDIRGRFVVSTSECVDADIGKILSIKNVVDPN
jgi:hypothetical protein